MRLNVNIKVNEIKLEEEKMQFVSLIKNALRFVDEDYFKEMYYYEDKMNKKSKNFTFATYYKDYVIENQVIKTNSDVKLVISTSDNILALKLVQALTMQRNYEYKNSKMYINKVNVEQEKKVNSNATIFRTLSTFTLNNKDKFYKLDDEDFEDALNYTMNLVLKNARNEGLREKLSFKNIDLRKVVVKEKIHDKTIYVDAYKGHFVLEGNTQDLQDIYQLGLGTKRSQGFGMLDIVC